MTGVPDWRSSSARASRDTTTRHSVTTHERKLALGTPEGHGLLPKPRKR